LAPGQEKKDLQSAKRRGRDFIRVEAPDIRPREKEKEENLVIKLRNVEASGMTFA